MPYIIEDDVLAPKGAEVVEYYGPNPFSIYTKIGGLLQTIFHARGLNVFEDQFRWDITTDPRPFFIQMHLNKKLDNFTRLYIFIKLYGAQPSDETKSGRLLLEIAGKIRTEYPSDTIWQKIFVFPFLWIYHHIFYNKIRRSYLQIAKRGIETLENELRSALRIIEKKRLT